ncbi:terpene synthase 1 [Cinnamomum micranthum f. kanehirae]|uniref:Terpene synthase 1 n=1 Tax=Cinnamomum micranthum f. kanehirae TaxID=337451 RepID=A0A443PS16_9MAGN|nr:terpene synthase 1 [Cinnamomum micranthum f. kanehirae]
MALVSGSGHSDGPNAYSSQSSGKTNPVRKSANYHPNIWGDLFLQSSPHDYMLDEEIKVRAEGLKDQVRRMLQNASDPLVEMNLIDSIQRLGVAYHFDTEVEEKLKRWYNAWVDGLNDGEDLHAVALQFRLLRQHGYNVSPDVFCKFKDNTGNFKENLARDIRSLLSLYEASFLGTHEEDILDEANKFSRDHLQLAVHHLSSPLSTLVKLALELPLQKRVQRLQARCYISIYEEERNDALLEFAKLDFNMLQSLHKRELGNISLWWKKIDFTRKLPFIRDRLVECYFWILEVYYQPQYSRGRMMATKIIYLTSVMDDIFDVYATPEELGPFTDAILRWDRGAADKLPDYMKVHFLEVLDCVDEFEKELAEEGQSYRIYYLKEAFKEVSKAYNKEAHWFHSGYSPSYSEYMRLALVTSGYPLVSVVSMVGMGEIVTKEALEWAMSTPQLIKACSAIARIKDDIQSNESEQERGHVASSVQLYMKENECTYDEACVMLQGKVERAWKDINKECLKPTPVPMPFLVRVVNLARVIEVLYQNRDGYTDSTHETKERILSVLVNPIPI